MFFPFSPNFSCCWLANRWADTGSERDLDITSTKWVCVGEIGQKEMRMKGREVRFCFECVKWGKQKIQQLFWAVPCRMGKTVRTEWKRIRIIIKSRVKRGKKDLKMNISLPHLYNKYSPLPIKEYQNFCLKSECSISVHPVWNQSDAFWHFKQSTVWYL